MWLLDWVMAGTRAGHWVPPGPGYSCLHCVHSRPLYHRLFNSVQFPIAGPLWRSSDPLPLTSKLIDLSSDFAFAHWHTNNRQVVNSYLPDLNFNPSGPQARLDSTRSMFMTHPLQQPADKWLVASANVKGVAVRLSVN